MGIAYLTALDEVEHVTQTKSDAIFTMVANEHRDNKELMIEAMQLIQTRYPGLIFEFKKNHVAQLLLHRQMHTLQHMAHEGELLDLDSSPLDGTITAMLKHLYLEPVKEHLRRLLFKTPLRYVTEPATKVLLKRGNGGRIGVSWPSPANAAHAPQDSSTHGGEAGSSTAKPQQVAPEPPAAANALAAEPHVPPVRLKPTNATATPSTAAGAPSPHSSDTPVVAFDSSTPAEASPRMASEL